MENNTRKKKTLTTALAVAVAALLLIGGGTFAYLQSQSDDTVNTFSTNKVTVELAETTGESYDIIPGTSQKKDPTVTVDNTVDAYVYVKVKTTASAKALVNYEIAEGWKILDGYDGTTEKVYYREVKANADDNTFAVLKDNQVSYDASLENSDMLNTSGNLKSDVKITFTAYAIQQNPFDDAVTAYKEKDTKFVSSDEEFNAIFNSSSKIVVSEDFTLSETKKATGNKSLILDGIITYTDPTNTGNANDFMAFWMFGSIGRPITLTLDGYGGIIATNAYCFNVGIDKNKTANLVINGGQYFAPVSVVNCQYGTVNINGGFFATINETEEFGTNYLLNCIDASYQNGTAKIIVTGGTFVNFNPADNQAEGSGTNFVADGYTVIFETQANGDIWYTVVPE